MTDGTETARQKKTPENGGKKRLRQLLICVVLFGAVFAGRGIDPEPISQLVSRVETMVQSEVDVQAVFARIGASFSDGALSQTLRALWTGEEETPAEEPAEMPAESGGGGEDGETPGT